MRPRLLVVWLAWHQALEVGAQVLGGCHDLGRLSSQQAQEALQAQLPEVLRPEHPGCARSADVSAPIAGPPAACSAEAVRGD